MSEIRDFIAQKKHHKYRTELESDFFYSQFKGLSAEERMTRRFEYMCSHQEPVILPGEKIVFLRTIANLPDCFSPEEWDEIKKDNYVHELGYNSNLCCDFEKVIKNGLLSLRKEGNEHSNRMIDALLSLCDRYAKKALDEGREEIYLSLKDAPRYGAKSFRQALQLFRIVHFALWLEGNYHNTCGRFDQYVYPFLKKDLDEGIQTRESALELLEDFFVSFNKDSDKYVGVQQGDNGQSMMLGGVDSEGNEVFNLLSELCLEASYKVLMIDPKLNLRVSKNTPDSVFVLGSKLTKAGLGFPQYSNDDVVIPALCDLGYSLEDARNYTVAACWEFIIPVKGADIANINALNFPAAVEKALRAKEGFDSFDDIISEVKREINDRCRTITQGINKVYFVPSPFQSLLLEPKYHNFGIHGTGVATAADSLAAVKEFVFDKKELSLKELLKAVDENFENSPELLNKLRTKAPKMGQNDDRSDLMSSLLLQSFADALKGKTNCLGGKFRAGTGTAMYYLWHADEIGASCDGRRKGEPFGTNFSPSIFAAIDGPFSVIESFSKQNFHDFINGGPLTLEFSQGMFGDEESITKIAMLVKAFIIKGGHQLQLNAVNAETLKKAQSDPDSYRQLIVRIWGWSAYFVELDKKFQDHVIMRREYSI